LHCKVVRLRQVRQVDDRGRRIADVDAPGIVARLGAVMHGIASGDAIRVLVPREGDARRRRFGGTRQQKRKCHSSHNNTRPRAQSGRAGEAQTFVCHCRLTTWGCDANRNAFATHAMSTAIATNVAHTTLYAKRV